MKKTIKYDLINLVMSQSISELAYLWGEVLNRAKVEIRDANAYESFFANSYIDRIEDDVIYIAAPTGLAATILETKFESSIKEWIKKTSGADFKLVFEKGGKKRSIAEEEEKKQPFFADCHLNENMTFDNFIVGDSNIQAYSAAKIVAEKPGTAYNPLFLFSDSGLGKTHLLHSIGNAIKKKNPKKKVLYCTTSDFIDEYVNFARGKNGDVSLSSFFKEDVDVLLIDDIQFLIGKKSTMEAFFVVFSALDMQGKQIVLTSDQHPSQLDGLDERLKTRFIHGLTLSIDRPDLETSESILRSRIERSKEPDQIFDDEVISFLAMNFSTSVRDLEQALNRLLFYTSAINRCKHIDLSVANDALRGLVDIRESQNKMSEQKVISVVADYYGLTPSQITGKNRSAQFVWARHVCMYLMRSLMDIPYKQIGDSLGGRDHATVISGVQKVENSLESDGLAKQAIEELKAKLSK